MTFPTTIYRVPLTFSDQQLKELNSYLTIEEQARAARYLVDRPRQQFVGCRVALKILLSGELNCAPSDVLLELGRWGKPRLKKSFIKSRSFATPPAVDAVPQAGNQICKSDSLLPHSELHTAAPPIEFSVSHSGETGLIGLSRLPIGVDIEFLKPRISLASLSNMVLSDSESQVWKLLPSQKRQHQMLRLWVCKEAVLKAMGLGIAECLQQVSFPIPVPEANVFSPIWIDPAIQIHLEEESSCSQNSWLQSQSWGIHNISEIENYTAAVAVLDRQACCESRDFNWSTALPL